MALCAMSKTSDIFITKPSFTLLYIIIIDLSDGVLDFPVAVFSIAFSNKLLTPSQNKYIYLERAESRIVTHAPILSFTQEKM